ncbi:gliding motility-associated peptidyl-prolyl isomerase GldI [Tenacibaculum tangerinum]|uniref:Peptidyl-prolyl cis-trans isomerase n=1 Tax=Tenacibaculum tangerinum TaxID=3038772 RepID=A0ABY8L575_9FLAO|nr:gliding motility-associated peptidyl-prolyl isomerase GldI [Tenacibaculum tangerinum]WGH76571.1 gliding motility-associated peptidyl-prolyl isomerase GldI [Tenacibaculum tangerinum]
MKRKIVVFIFVVLAAISCKEPEARRPKQQGTTNFYKEVIKENKKLNALEKERLEQWIAKDTLKQYNISPNGFWYTYVKKDSVSSVTPQFEDVVLVSYDVVAMNGETLYTTKQRSYKVDKEDFIPALQDGIKLMKKGETITFVIPSYRAFGVTGDGNKIAVNQPIQSTVTLIDIKSEKQ